MSKFINTIDIKKDEDIFNELVTRTITEFKDNVIQSVGYAAFNCCYDLEVIDIPNASIIEGYAFANCAKLTTINIPSTRSIGSNAFYMAKIIYIKLPNIKTIASNAFAECINLTKIDINACEMRHNTFAKSALNTIIIRGANMAKLNTNNVFSGTPIESGDGYIYVSKSLVDSYKSATNWSAFASRIRAIEDYPDICE